MLLITILAAGIAVRLVVAVVLTKWNSVDSFMLDAMAFHYSAAAQAQHWVFVPAIDHELYSNLLAYVYSVFGTTRLVGNLSSVAGFLIFSALLFRIMVLAGDRRYYGIPLLVLVMLPAGVIYTAIPLREPWQLSALAGIVLGMFYYLRKNRVRGLVYVLAGAVVLGISHKALVMYSAGVVVAVSGMVLFHNVRGRGSSAGRMLAVILLVAAVGSTVAITLLKPPGSGLVYGVLTRSPLAQIREYRDLIENEQPRSAFDVGLDTDSYSSFVASAGAVYLRYMFGPPPSTATSLKDLYAVSESLLRVILLVGAIYAIRASNPERRAGLLVLATIYFSLTAYWTLGTTNYGQAVRHHVLTNWMLILMGGDQVVRGIARFSWRKKTVSEGMVSS